MLNLSIITPEGPIYESDEVESISIPTETGEIMILDGHMQLMTLLLPGTLEISTKGEKSELIVSSGVAKVQEGNKVSLMVETAHRIEDIDLEQAREAHKRAEEYLSAQDEIDDVDFARAQARILTEMAKIDAASKYVKQHKKQPQES